MADDRVRTNTEQVDVVYCPTCNHATLNPSDEHRAKMEAAARKKTSWEPDPSICQTAQQCRGTHKYAGEQTNWLRKYREAARAIRDRGSVIDGESAKVPLDGFNELIGLVNEEERELLDD